MEKEARRPPRWLYGGAVLAVAALSYSAGVVAPVPVPGWRSCRRYWSESDPLTGVLSRRAFTARFQSTLRKALPGTCYALVMLDLDAFKQINDTCGHPCGDQVLCRVTRELRRTLRSDDMVGRLGGDEFIVCLRDIRGNALERRLQELCHRLRWELEGGPQVSVSIGAASYPWDGTEFQTLYRKADFALYQAKQAGRAGYCIYQPELEARLFRHCVAGASFCP